MTSVFILLAYANGLAAPQTIKLACPSVRAGDKSLELTAEVSALRRHKPEGWLVKLHQFGSHKIAGWESVSTNVPLRQAAKPVRFSYAFQTRDGDTLLSLDIPGGVQDLAGSQPHLEVTEYTGSFPDINKRILASVNCNLMNVGIPK